MREELVVAILMFLISAVGSIVTKNDRKWSVVFLLLASIAGSLAAGMGVRFREIVEGPFGYLDAMLTVVSATVFVFLLYQAGAFDSLWEKISGIRNCTVKAFLVLGFLVLPSAFTGFAGATLLTTGKIVADSMEKSRVEKKRITEVLVVSAFLGMILPPLSIPAIIAANGAGSVLPTPYNGFYAPLLALGLPLFILYALLRMKTLSSVEKGGKKASVLYSVILLIVAAATVVDGMMGGLLYIGGSTLWFFLGALAVLVVAKGFGSPKKAYEAVSSSLMEAVVPVAFTFALGSFIEVSSMTGVRGLYSLYILPYSVPKVMLVLMALSVVLGIFLSVPLPAFLLTYAVFPIGWLANPVIVVGISTALAVVSLVSLRGGLLDRVREGFGYQSVKKSEVLPATLILVALTLILGVVFVLCGDGFLSFLNF